MQFALSSGGLNDLPVLQQIGPKSFGPICVRNAHACACPIQNQNVNSPHNQIFRINICVVATSLSALYLPLLDAEQCNSRRIVSMPENPIRAEIARAAAGDRPSTSLYLWYIAIQFHAVRAAVQPPAFA